MPRKKEIQSGTHEKFIPKGRLQDLKKLAIEFEFIENKDLALSKYIEFISSLIDRSIDVDSKQAPVNFDTQRRMLGMDYGFKQFLQSLVQANFIVKDVTNFKIGECSFEYKPVYSELEIIHIEKKSLSVKTNKMLEGSANAVDNYELKQYSNVINKITIDNKIYNDVNDIIKNIKYNEHNKQNKLNNTDCPFNYSFVPYDKILKNSVDTHYSFVPCSGKGVSTTLPHYSFVPFTSVAKLPSELYGLYNIQTCKFKVHRPIKDSRVYSNLTNLSRHFRPYLRLNGKPLIGFDIANSQPLIAAVAFRMHSQNNYGCIKADVLEYQKACELGLFYEYFMKLNGIDTNDEDARTDFKKKFFAQVFYSMNYAKTPVMLQQFIDKYPTCYEAIYNLKGGKWFAQEYKNFPKLMTIIETYVMWESNVELINKNYDVVNIFDSLYSDSEEAIEEAKKIVVRRFAELKICPKLKDINYNTQKEIPMEAKVINMYKVQRTPEQEAAFQKTIAYNQYRIDHAAELLNIFELNKREFDARFEKEYAELLKKAKLAKAK